MKKIIISGSSSGIGRAITLKLLLMGHQVIGLARNHSKFDPKHPSYFPYQIDFSVVKSAEEILKKVAREHADAEIIIGNAGYGRFGMLEQFSTQQILDLMNVNFIGQVILVKAFLPLLKQRQQGKIILMGSESALTGAKQGTIYCASKFALRGFAQSLRAECRCSGISVSLVNPGLVNTSFFDALHFKPGTQPKNSLSPETIASTVVSLLQDNHCFLVEEINLQPMAPAIEWV